jgi:hypothetical protein
MGGGNLQSAAAIIISAMITPALLILASGSLVASALLRLGRSVDRARWVIVEAAAAKLPADVALRWLDRHQERSLRAERAVALLFAAVTIFVAGCLAIAVDRYLDGKVVWLPVGLTIVGMVLLLVGAGYMFFESSLGALQIREEIQRARDVMAARPPSP